MSLVKILVVDPEPRSHPEDVIVFQVPEHSRTHALLIDMLTAHNYEFVEVELPRRRVRHDPTVEPSVEPTPLVWKESVSDLAEVPAFLRKQAD